MVSKINFDEIQRSSNDLSSAISHLEIAKELIYGSISKLDDTMLCDLPIDEINRRGEEYLDGVRFIQNRLEKIVQENTAAVYAPPDILFWKS